jgi:immune inhibitor A
MFRKLFNLLLIAVFAGGLSGVSPVSKVPTHLKPVAIGALPVQGRQLVAPRDDKVLHDLELAGIVSKDSTPYQVQMAVQQYHQDFGKKSGTWVNPKVAAAALAHEDQLTNTEMGLTADPAVTPVTVTIFGLAVDFKKSATHFTGSNCDQTTVDFTGPAVGEVPTPAAGDNGTIWYEPDDVKDLSVYEKLTFGYTGAGVVRKDLNSGAGVDLSGFTVQDYYDKVSGAKGRVTLQGEFNGWVTAPHDEAYYGAPVCDPVKHKEISSDSKPEELVADAIDAFNAANPSFDWSEFDQDGDQIVDTFWIIHAGAGEEVGGGAQGDFAIWSHSSDLRYYAAYPDGYQVAGMATPNNPADDIFVGPYTMNPEMADVGVLSEEFGHNVFGLPDLYSTDVDNSVGFWNIMSAGSYGGPLAGAAPVGMPLWFRMMAWCGGGPCNWQYPMVTRDYKDSLAEIKIGTLEDTPVDTVKGVRINLPKVKEDIPNKAGLGTGAWSGSGRDATDVILEKTLAVPTGAAGVLSFDSFWDIEEDWDYGYVAVKDGASAWVYLDDTGSYFRNTNPNGNNKGNGLTGTSSAATNLKFNLHDYAGKSIQLRLWYKLDAASNQNGWWVDNLKLDGNLIDDFSSASGDGTFPGWTNSTPDGWYVVPSFKQYNNYYLLEYRGNTKYDSQVKTAYVTVDSGPNLWKIEHVPYNIPGGLLYYRSAKYPGGYSQFGYYGDPPSYGPKNKLLVVDMNYEALPIGNTGYIFGNRVAAYDATLTLHSADPFTISGVYGLPPDAPKGPYTVSPQGTVTEFNDVHGYYAGFEANNPFDGDLYWSNRDGSAVIPARSNYSTRIRYWDGMMPAYDLYGLEFPPSWLGSGQPGDDNVQLGVNIVMTDEQPSYGTFMFYNYSLDYMISETKKFQADSFLYTYEITIQNSGALPSLTPTDSGPSTTAALQAPIDPALLVILLDNDMTLKSISVDAVQKPAPDSVGYGTILEWAVPTLNPGESLTVTLVANGPVGTGKQSDQVLIAGDDGQVNRGPWLYTNNYTHSVTWFPFLPNKAATLP